MKTYIISLGGSLIFPKDIDVAFLRKFRKFILGQIKKGKRFVIICGGGDINKQYNKAITQITRADDEALDWMGINATRMNAFFVKTVFGDHTYKDVVDNPTKKIKTGKRIIIGSGWKPGCSTDMDAVLAAKTYHPDTIINLTNVSYVYTKDPHKFRDAEKIKEIKWREFRKLVGSRWSPRLNAPFDPVAARLAQKMGLKVVIADGRDLNNLKRVLEGKNFKGTKIY